MTVHHPLHHVLAKTDGQPVHFVGFTRRCGTSTLVVGEISLSAHAIERVDEASVGGDRQPKRLYGAFVGAQSLGSITFRGQRKRGELKRRVVRDAEAPIGAQPIDRRVLEVSINDGEQVGDLFGAALVFREPPVFQPGLQCHLRCPRA